MERYVRLRLALAATVLAASYYCILIIVIGWTSAIPWPSWWIASLPNRYLAVRIWVIGFHMIGVFSAAIPAAVAAVLIVREQTMLVGMVAGVSGTILLVFPSLSPDIWPLIWNSHPIYVITDQIELLIAVPSTVPDYSATPASAQIINGNSLLRVCGQFRIANGIFFPASDTRVPSP